MRLQPAQKRTCIVVVLCFGGLADCSACPSLCRTGRAVHACRERLTSSLPSTTDTPGRLCCHRGAGHGGSEAGEGTCETRCAEAGCDMTTVSSTSPATALPACTAEKY